MKTLFYIFISATIISITSCVTIYQTNPETIVTDKKVDKLPQKVDKLPQEKEKVSQTPPPVVKTNSYAYYKGFHAADNDKWYKIATIKSKGNMGKHVCVFKIYSTVSPHKGVYYGSFFLNLRRGMDADEMYGHFYCTDWNKDEVSGFSPNDFCVTYSGSFHDEITTIIWKKASNISEDVFIFGAEYVVEGVTFTFAENSYYGAKECMSRKPSVADGFDFVIDVEDKVR
ncbi:MAG: hypothetical protein FWC39_14045 [Bacteroidetes bacterium]|nr:hypothetical protein [Bacteroidota bacterium]